MEGNKTPETAREPVSLLEKYEVSFFHLNETVQMYLEPYLDQGLGEKLQPTLFFDTPGYRLYIRKINDAPGYNLIIKTPIDLKMIDEVGDVLDPQLAEPEDDIAIKKSLGLAKLALEILNTEDLRFVRLELSPIDPKNK